MVHDYYTTISCSTDRAVCVVQSTNLPPSHSEIFPKNLSVFRPFNRKHGSYGIILYIFCVRDVIYEFFMTRILVGRVSQAHSYAYDKRRPMKM